MKQIPPGMLDEIVKRLLETLQPLEIYLFGSHACGTPHTDSDLDFLVAVSDDAGDRHELAEKGWIAVAAAMLGQIAAVQLNTNTAGTMAVLVGLFYLAAVCCSPRYGILRDDSRITSPFGKGTVPFSLRENRDSPQLVLASSLSRLAGNLRTSLRIVREDLLGMLYRLEELAVERPFDRRQALQAVGGGLLARAGLWWLLRRGQVQRDGPSLRLTDTGRRPPPVPQTEGPPTSTSRRDPSGWATPNAKSRGRPATHRGRLFVTDTLNGFHFTYIFDLRAHGRFETVAATLSTFRLAGAAIAATFSG